MIDRRATRYRLTQEGSQFDTKDALDIQKKEELNRRGNVMKETSSGGVSAELEDTLKQQHTFINERLMEVNKQKYELEERMKLWREQHDEMASALSKQSLPEVVIVHSMASSYNSPGQSRTHKETIDYPTDKKHLSSSTYQLQDILFQLHLRGITLTEEEQNKFKNLPVEGKGTRGELKETRKDFLLSKAVKLISDGIWQQPVQDDVLRIRMEAWRKATFGEVKGKWTSSIPEGT